MLGFILLWEGLKDLIRWFRTPIQQHTNGRRSDIRRITMSRDKITNLQALIEKRAGDKLHEDMKDLSNAIGKLKLLTGIDGIPGLKYKHPTGGDPEGWKAEPSTFHGIFQYSTPHYSSRTSYFMGELYAAWLPMYIEREITEFAEKLDSMDAQLEDLRQGIANRQYED